MTASIRILTIATLDSNPSLLIVSPDGSKTLINCGEGCQRAFLESATASSADVGALRIGSVRRVCLTHIGADTLGGLPGMILTTADVIESISRDVRASKKRAGGDVAVAAVHGGDDRREEDGNDGKNNTNGHERSSNNDGIDRRKRDGSLISNHEDGRMPDLEIIGPEGIKTFLHALRHFMRRDRFRVHAHEGRYDSSLNDDGGASGSFNGRKRTKRKKSTTTGHHDGSEADAGFNVRSIPISHSMGARQAVSYLFATPPLPGKFLLDKALALGVPKGPLFAQLKAGRTITFVDAKTNEERTVMSEECVAECSPGVGVAVVYCPTLGVLSELRETEAFRAMEKSRGNDSNGNVKSGGERRAELYVMVHLTPKSVFRNAAYRSWCELFGPDVDHVTLHSVETLEERTIEDDDSPFVSGIIGGIRRSFVNNTLYPTPSLALTKSRDDGIVNCADGDSDVLSTIEGCSMMDYVLMPRSRRGVNSATLKSQYSKNTLDNLEGEVNESGAVDVAAAVFSGGGFDDCGPDVSRNDLGELIFTGTGSAVPCKHRNVTGMYLRMNNGNALLLDVGEGTMGQLLRSWKSTLPSNRSAIDEYRSRVRCIKAVWISHPHADHHLGLLRLLSERAAICGEDDPIVLMAPPDMFAFLKEYQSVAPEINHSYLPVDCFDMIHGREHPLGKRLNDELGITNCMSTPVAHCIRSYAVVIDGTPFGKIAYSGDCRPSVRFADVGFGTDLLIHEATFEDGMEDDAVLKRHSTVGEAINVASKMNAKSLVLTHFSQRYPKIPPMKTNHETNPIPIVFAFDFMRLTAGSIELAAKLTPALRMLYPEAGVSEEETNVAETTAKELMAIPGIFATKGIL
jgi:ribonuclease Z